MTYPTHPGFTLKLVEEFETPVDFKSMAADEVWTWSDGALDEGDVQFGPDAITFTADGYMNITVTATPSVGGTFSFAENKMVAKKPLSSGELRTKYNNFRYGRYEVNMKTPSQAAPKDNFNYINTMFIFRTPKTEDWRELDNEVTGDAPTGLLTNLIFGNNQMAWSAGIAEPTTTYPTGAGAMALPAGFNNRTGYHTYAFEWTPGSVKWFVDDVLIRVKGAGGLPVPEKSAKIMMNIWIFNSSGLGGNRANDVFPIVTSYDWFRFYKWDMDDTYPCSPVPTCLPAADLNLSKNNAMDGVANIP
jgi:beta-glucanase (GH16 family)